MEMAEESETPTEDSTIGDVSLGHDEDGLISVTDQTPGLGHVADGLSTSLLAVQEDIGHTIMQADEVDEQADETETQEGVLVQSDDQSVSIGNSLGHPAVFVQTPDGLVSGDVLDTPGITLVQPGDSIDGLETAFSVTPEGIDGSNAQLATINGQPVLIVSSNHEAALSALHQQQQQQQLQQQLQQQQQQQEEEANAKEDENLEPPAKRFKLDAVVVSVSDDKQQVAENDEGALQVVADKEGSEEGASTNGGDDDQEAGDTDVSQAWFTTKDDKNAFHNKGCQWRQGQWSREEVEVLQANIAHYCKENNIGDPTEVIFEMTKDERKDFYRTIARGLQRPLFSVYRRVIRMYDQRNHIGKYSPEEIKKLRELRAKHGTDWSTIGQIMGRSASSVKDRCRLMKDTCNTGKWLPEEEKRLTNAVYELSGQKVGEPVDQGLSWSMVAERVATRSEKQCRTKWLNYLNWKQRGGSEWTREDDIALIYKIVNSGATEESELDWRALAKDWSSARSPQWLRGKWWTLKRHVPDYGLLPFTDIVEFLRAAHTQSLWVGVEHLNLNRVQLNLTTTTAQLEKGLDQAEATEEVDATTTLATDAEGNPLQTYEVLQSLAPNVSQGAFLITQPHNNPALSIATAGNVVGDHNAYTTDHIIVHTLPISQLQNVEGLSVQMENGEGLQVNPRVIIGAVANGTAIATQDGTTISTPGVATVSAAGVAPASLQFTGAIENSVEDLQSLAESQQITIEPVISLNPEEENDETELTTDSPIDQSNLATETQELKEEDATTDVTEHAQAIHVVEGSVVNATPDLVLAAASNAQFVQAGTDLIHLSSLTDPMLTAESSDLIGSSDVEADKSNSTDIVTDDCTN